MSFDDRIPRILEFYSVIGEFRRDYGSVIKRDRGGSKLDCRCPFHDDTRSSFRVDQDGFRCFSASCGVTGDVIDYVMLRDSCGKSDAINLLAEQMNMPNRPSVKRDPEAAREKFVPIEISYIDQFYANLSLALPWFNGRAVTEVSGHLHRLGADPRFYWNYYDAQDVAHRFEAPRYSIPNIRMRADPDGILSPVGIDVNFRRDDATALRLLRSHPDKALMKKIGDEIAEEMKCTSRDILYEDMLDACFGPKYWRRGAATRLFNAGAVVVPKPGGNFEPRRLSSVLIVEGEIDAMSLAERGYNAVAVKYSNGIDLTKAMAGVAHIYIVKDIDPDKMDRFGNISNGGRKNAEQLFKHFKECGRDSVTIIEPPKGCRDSNDVIIKGDVRSWLMGFGIVPARPVAHKAS